MTINALSRSLTIVPYYDGKLYTRYPTGGVQLSLQAVSMGQTVSNGGTITIPRYAGVMFDLTGTTAEGIDVPFVQLHTHHDYGYATPTTPGNHTQSGLPKGNDVGGLIRKHVYETAGTYEYTVRVQIPGGLYAEGSITVVVQEPSAYFTNTVAITAGGVWPTWANDTLYTMADDLSCSAKGTLSIPFNVNNIWIMGNPSAPARMSGAINVCYADPSGSTVNPAYNIGLIGLSGHTDFEIQHAHSVHAFGLTGESINVGSLVDYHYGVYGGSSMMWPFDITLAKCNLVSVSGGDQPYFGGPVAYLGVIDCNWDYGTCVALGHVARSQGGYKQCFHHSKFHGSPDSGKAFWTMRGQGLDSWTRVIDDAPDPEGIYFLAANNIFGDAADAEPTWQTSFMPSAASSDASLSIQAVRQGLILSCTYTKSRTGANRKVTMIGENLGVVDCGLAAEDVGYFDETRQYLMTHDDFIPVYSENGFNEGYLANERITLTALTDPGKAGS